MEEETPEFSILFVDDEKNILSSLKRLFRSENYVIHTATSGQEGLNILESASVDVIVSDMRMPMMDGAEFLKNVAIKWPDSIRILLTGFADLTSTISAVNEGNIYKYISKPWEDNDIKLTIRNALREKQIEHERDALLEITKRQNDELVELNTNLEKIVEKRTYQLKKTFNRLSKSHEVLKGNFLGTVKVLSTLTESREGNVAGHSRKVAEEAKKLAISLGLDEDETQQVLLAALLHDIGKVVLPDLILNRPITSFSTDEKKKYARHPVIGQNMVKDLDSFEEIGGVIRSHHEMFDGTGYPDRLKGDGIPLGARILCVANEFWALQQGTLLSHKQSLNDALDYMHRHKGSRYDPRVVTHLLKLYGKGVKSKEVVESYRTLNIKSVDLRSGMKINEDIVTRDGIVLLKKGRRFDTSVINKIVSYEKESGHRLSFVIRIDLLDMT